MNAIHPSVQEKLVENKSRIQEAILYLMNLRSGLSQYDIVKSLFLADRSHMNKYGRPITFDNYVAMEHGPVPSLAYDALKPSFHYKSMFGADRPWTSIPDRDNPGVNRYTPLRAAQTDYLSVSDTQALNAALGTVCSLSFSQLRKLTHEDRAYEEAWGRRGKAKAAKMRLALLIDEDGDKLASELSYLTAN